MKRFFRLFRMLSYGIRWVAAYAAHLPVVLLSVFWGVIAWPFRTRGVARERVVLAAIGIVGFGAAMIVYPPLWNRSAALVQPQVLALGELGSWRAGGAEWPKRVAEIFAPGPVPSTWLGRNLEEYALGLDLIGGTQLEYEADTSALQSGDVDEALSALRDTIERRVNIFGVREPVVQLLEAGGPFGGAEGSGHRLLVELAGISDTSEAIKKVGNPIFLEFREETELPETGPTGEPLDLSTLQITPDQLFRKPEKELTGQYLDRADVVFDPTTNAPQVQLTFNGEGAEIFRDLTSRNVQKRLAIFLNEDLVTAPTVQQEISGGTAVITGQFTLDEAKALARNLNAGALPVPITLVSQRTVGATLGAESLEQMIRAGIATLVLIVAFMALWYRVPGLLALLALGLYGVLLLALFKLAPITMTLAGIAGLILSVGMAVDANILIFARMREERREGRMPLGAVDEGFRRAWPAIRDSNVATLLTTGILFTVGTSFVQGFALALGIGVAVSMFTAVFISRYLLRMAARSRQFTQRPYLW